nr:MAG TPA: hypothetical protein [Caudoviricetes sp.]
MSSSARTTIGRAIRAAKTVTAIDRYILFIKILPNITSNLLIGLSIPKFPSK